VIIGQGESTKSLATIESLSQEFADMGITRNDVIIGVGGGMVTDIAGFAASTWHRGTSVVHVATSLLAMVDAAIGGKTGVNLPQGKNLVGAFWQPSAVFCDLDLLASLPEKEMRCGLGEVAKYHFLTGDDLLALSLDERVARCVGIKGSFVEQDERESGKRAFLNYGHTLAHALETVGQHQLAHGEAVAIGLIFAARLARALGRIDDARVDYHERVVGQTYSLQTRMPAGLDIDQLMAAMARDKKALHGLTFILDSPQGLEIVAGISAEVVRSELVSFSQA
jgi:5-deoxy-5-amino-3-dehydroquinate synthase